MQGLSAAQGSLASSLSSGFDLLLSFKDLCVVALALGRDWDSNQRMWLRRKSHLIEVTRKHSRDFALPTVFQCLTLLRFVSLVC